VSTSSGPRTAITTTDPSDIIHSIRVLRREVTRIGESNPGAEYSRIAKRLEALENSVRLHVSQLGDLEQALATASNTRLTDKQRTILRWLVAHHGESAIYTVLIQQLSEELKMPESTVRWNLKGLRDAELIMAGTKDNKGVPVSLTTMGRIMAGYAAPMD